jgi:hypothetical protein
VAPIKRKRATQPAAVLAACALASIGIAACGGGSSKDASANGATSTSTSTSTTGSAAGAARFAAMRSCLSKEGITLPQRQAFRQPHGGAAGGPGGGFPGGGGGFGRHLPKGVSAEKLQSALKKCGGNFPGGFHGGFHGGRGGVFKSAKDKTALTAFAACMRENGVKLPAPNTSGQGPVFDTKGLDTSSSQFKHAVEKCHSKLPGPFAGQGGPPPSGGA